MTYVDIYNLDHGTNFDCESIKECRRDYFGIYSEPFDGCWRDASCADCWKDTYPDE